jgi:alkanesulfonate monooxygenase SsuD/methylene tetrahydromethanopterin reductase-like flavin-dependent oxidoreductase (luciferase family)
MVCNKLVIYGSPQKVADEILAFRDEIGEFGILLYAGMDWQDRDKARRSMILLAEKVIPLVNSATRKAVASPSKLEVSNQV